MAGPDPSRFPGPQTARLHGLSPQPVCQAFELLPLHGSEVRESTHPRQDPFDGVTIPLRMFHVKLEGVVYESSAAITTERRGSSPSE